jgi:hypothetical protein
MVEDAHVTNSMEHTASLEANRSSTSQEITLHFMELEGSVPYLQDPAICPYPEPDRSGP